MKVEENVSIQCPLLDMIHQLQKIELPVSGPIGRRKSDSMLFTAYNAGLFSYGQELERWSNDHLTICQDIGHVRMAVPFLTFCHVPDSYENDMTIIDANQNYGL